MSGSGKTTIGQALARRLGYEFIEGDEFHSRANREKMHAGVPLNDDGQRSRGSRPCARAWPCSSRATATRFVTCSALKKSYRDVLRLKGVRFIYLQGESRRCFSSDSRAVAGTSSIRPCWSRSSPHCEEPRDAIVVDADASDLDVVSDIVRSAQRRRDRTSREPQT